MSYLVKKTFFNGYRCGCCMTTEDSVDTCQTLEEALQHFPQGADINKLELLKIKIVENSSGQKIAWGRLEWPLSGHHTENSATRWHGFNGTTAFDSAGSLELWEKKLQSVKRDLYTRQLEEVQEEMKRLLKKEAFLKKMLEES